MHYRFINLDGKTYHRDATGPLTIESKKADDGRIEVSFADTKGAFIIMHLNDQEAATICSAVFAAMARAESTVHIRE